MTTSTWRSTGSDEPLAVRDAAGYGTMSQQLFRAIDTDNDGSITKEELAAYLAKTGGVGLVSKADAAV